MSTIVPPATPAQGPLTDEQWDILCRAAVTNRQLVNIWFPDCSETFAHWLLWEMTPFPVCSIQATAERLADLAANGPVCAAITHHGRCSRKVSDWGDSCWQHRGGDR